MGAAQLGPARQWRRRSRALTPGGLIDALVMAALLASAGAGLWPVFGGPAFILPAAGGMACGALLAWLGAWRRWPSAVLALGATGLYFLAGSALAQPAGPRSGPLPTLNNLAELAFGAVEVWREFLTATVPLAGFEGMTLVPFILLLIASTAGFSLAWRAPRPAWALVAPLAALVAVIALGAATAFQPLAQAAVFAVLAPPWLAYRSRTAGAAPPVRRLALWRDGAAVLGAGLVGIVLLGIATAPSQDRDVARKHVVPPLDLRSYASPLTSFRAMVRDQSDTTLFTVEGWDESYRLRLAVMDSYDGTVYKVGGGSRTHVYDRVAERFDLAEATGGEFEVEVTVGDYRGVWVPGVTGASAIQFAGQRAEELSRDLYRNPEADALVDATALAAGDQFRLTARPPREWTDAELGGLQFARADLGSVAEVPDVVAATASDLVGDAMSPIEQVRNLTAALQADGFFSHGLADQAASLPGHSAWRVASMLSDPQWIGDDEQYAVAAALMCRQLGIPARVVMGFRTDQESDLAGRTWRVTGADVHAWIEVAFDEAGWVAFDPVPPEDQVPVDQLPQSRSEPQPQVLQQPPPPEPPEEVTPESAPEEQDAEEEDEEQSKGSVGAVLRLAAWISLPLAAVLGPPLAVVSAKRRRRGRRRRAPEPSRRLAGGWQEIVDCYTDLGLAPSAAATRQEAGDALARQAADPGLAALARVADRGVFGPGQPSEEEVAAYWRDVASATRFAGRRLSLWRRLRAAVALTSLRRQGAVAGRRRSALEHSGSRKARGRARVGSGGAR
ncbi:MAG: DUF3488 and transglutaminase-like domain-containing protein [Bifidobacteriaceae bacterium]|jgi:transglutaminase-like putative cysteine protease|nr:DUF3488 and transglutaminase-like domain-containing protein [Bifidobacteriaceae bacterium]